MKARLLISLSLICSAALLGVSIGRAKQSEAAPGKNAKNRGEVFTELDRAPEKARTRRNPLETDPEAVQAGQILFERYCAECHGAAAGGGRHAPSLREAEVQDATPGAIFWILTNGIVRHGMPVWSKLPEPQRWQLVAFLKSAVGEPEKSRPH